MALVQLVVRVFTTRCSELLVFLHLRSFNSFNFDHGSEHIFQKNSMRSQYKQGCSLTIIMTFIIYFVLSDIDYFQKKTQNLFQDCCLSTRTQAV